MKEATITINGQTLTLAQSMTVRVALSSFQMSLKEEGLGDDETGKAICDGYLKCIKQTLTMIHNEIKDKT